MSVVVMPRTRSMGSRRMASAPFRSGLRGASRSAEPSASTSDGAAPAPAGRPHSSARNQEPPAATSSATSAPAALTISATQLRAMIEEVAREVVPAVVATCAAAAPTDDAAPEPSENLLVPPAQSGDAASAAGMAEPEFPACETAPSVAATVRQRIITDRYIDLGMLLDIGDRGSEDRPPMFQLVDGLLRPVSRTPRTINSFGTWCLCFLRYTSIYLEAHPTAAAGLLAHMRQVGQLATPQLGLAWREFDEAVRKAREAAPERHPWGETPASSAIWLQAVAKGVGGVARFHPVGAASRPAGRSRFCYSFNQPRGCTARPCRFAHICHTCRGSHPATRCPKRQSQSRSRAAAAGPASSSH